MGYAESMFSDRRLRKSAYFLSPIFLASGLRKLMQLTSGHSIDIIHAYWVIPNGPIGAPVARIRGIPLIVSLHGSDIYMARKNRFLGRIANACFSEAQAVTACSPQLQEGALALGSDPAHTQLIPWGADPDVFELAVNSDSDKLRRQLEIPETSSIILSLGRLVDKKGIEYLLKAIPLIHKHHADAFVIIAGEGPERARLEQLAVTLGIAERTRFVGNVSWQQVPEYLFLSDLFVVPSVEDKNGNLDGMPTTILEAMAAGKPVIASDIAGIPLVVHDGETGLLVEQRESVQLAEAVCLLLDDSGLRLRLGLAARSRVEKSLNWDSVAQAFLALYKEALVY
jgi:glycosyltransferase involved in cell wall biosynthesis